MPENFPQLIIPVNLDAFSKGSSFPFLIFSNSVFNYSKSVLLPSSSSQIPFTSVHFNAFNVGLANNRKFWEPVLSVINSENCFCNRFWKTRNYSSPAPPLIFLNIRLISIGGQTFSYRDNNIFTFQVPDCMFELISKQSPIWTGSWI